MGLDRPPRIPVCQPAEIIFAGERTPFGCTVRNLSANGACLEFASANEAPASVFLILNHRKYNCRVIWRTDNKLGVAFQ